MKPETAVPDALCQLSPWQQTLAEIDRRGIYPTMRTGTCDVTTPEPVVDGHRCLSFGSNDYLSLSQNPQVKLAACQAIEQYGVGPGYSRLIGATPQIVQDLESELADWCGFEAAAVYPTGYVANVSAISVLLDRLFASGPSPWAVLIDERVHGSLLDGCVLAQVRVIPYRHNNLEDLERKANRFAGQARLIVTESIFPLEGTIIDLERYVQLGNEHGLMTFVDDAHGIGILGTHGGGIGRCGKTGLKPDLYMSSMDKALGCTGGVLAGSRELVRLLQASSRSSILSSCLPAVLAGAGRKSVELAQSMDKERSDLIQKAAGLRARLRHEGFTVYGSPDHPSVSVRVGAEDLALKMEQHLWEQGVFQPAMRWPAVPAGQSRIRINVCVAHTQYHIDRLVEALLLARQVCF